MDLEKNIKDLNLVPVIRKSFDVIIEGQKSRGKTFFLSINAYLEYLNGKNIFSNYHLNDKYMEYYYIEDIEDVHSMSNGIFLGDDFERVMSSKWMKKNAQEAMADILLDMGKNSVSVWATTKRFMECEKSLRSICDRFLNCSLALNCIPGSYEEYLYKSQYLNYLQLEVKVYDNPEEEPVEYEYYTNLDVFKDLFDTKEKVSKVYKEKEKKASGVFKLS